MYLYAYNLYTRVSSQKRFFYSYFDLFDNKYRKLWLITKEKRYDMRIIQEKHNRRKRTSRKNRGK